MVSSIVLAIVFLASSSSFQKNFTEEVVAASLAGQADTSFSGVGTGPNSSVMASALQSDGSILIGGYFTSYNGTSRGGIARIGTNGLLDTTFLNTGQGVFLDGSSGMVQSIIVQGDGKILIGGTFNTYNGTTRRFVARLNTDGSLDTTFLNTGYGSNNGIEAMAIQSDGKIIIGGRFTAYNEVNRGYIARINTDGSLDTTFLNTGVGADAKVATISIQSDGKIIIGGEFTSYNGTSRGHVARLNTDGSLDTSFLSTGAGSGGYVYASAVQSDGKILIGGALDTYNGVDRACFARLNSDGSLDTSFLNTTSGPNSNVNAIYPLSDGKILIAGYFSAYNGVSRGEVAKINSDGSLDTVFLSSGAGATGGSVFSLLYLSGGRAVISGAFTSYNGSTANKVAKILTDTASPTGGIIINNGDSSTASSSVTLAINGSDDISVYQMMVCNDSDFSGCSWEAYSTSKSWTLSSGDGTKTVYIKFRDSTQNESSTYSDTIVLDTQSPTGSIVINSGATYTTTATVSLAINGSDSGVGLSQMMICNASDFSGCSWETYGTSKSWTLSSGDGTKTVYIKFRDTLLNESSSYNDVITLDTQSPFGSVLINSGDQYASSLSVTLTVSATDTTSGLSQMMICNASDFSGCNWETYSTSKSWTLSSGDGTKTVYVKFNDLAGNASSSYNDTIVLDTQSPTGSIAINGGSSYTSTANVSLTINGADTGAGLSQMMVCNASDFSGCSWETYSTSKSWTLSSGDGTKTVYIKFKDSTQNESSTYSDTIVLDTQSPTGSVVINSGATYTTTATVSLAISGSDAGVGLSQMMICNASDFSGCSWETYGTSKSWTLSSGNGTKTVYIQFNDMAGNTSASYSDTVSLDTQIPTGSISINNDASYTTSSNVNLTISGSDVGSGLSQMMVCSSSDFSGCAWESYSTTKSWALGSEDGTKTVYVKFNDLAGNVSVSYNDSIILDTQGPSGSIVMNSGNPATSNSNATITIASQDIGSGISQMIVCNASDFSGCSWEPYSTSKSWTLLGTDGVKTVYVKFEDNAGNESPVYSDVITLDTQPPSGSILINSGDSETSTQNVTLTLSATDTTSGLSQMLVCNNSSFTGCVWESYVTAKSWILTDGNGSKTVYAEFKDVAGNVSALYDDNITLNIPIDTTVPTGSVGINNGQSTTTSVNVTLQLQATDDSSGVSQMMICNDSSFGSCSWESYMTSKSWKLTSGNGTKTVYAKFKDNAGNISLVYSDTITLNVSNISTDTTQKDTIGPTGSFKINGGAISTNSTNVTLTISATDDKSGVSQMILCNNSDLGTCVWRAYSTSATWTLSSGNGTKSVYIMFKDGAGNLSVVYNEAILLYTTANNDSGQSSGDSTSSLLDTQYRTDITVTDDIANYSLVKIKITDQDGNPISGLTVTIDGSKTSITDSSGIVTFNDISDGEHTLSFTYQGKKQSKKIIIKGTIDTSGKTAVLDIVTVEAENGTISVWLLVGGGTVLMVLATFIVIKVLKKKRSS